MNTPTSRELVLGGKLAGIEQERGDLREKILQDRWEVASRTREDKLSAIIRDYAIAMVGGVTDEAALADVEFRVLAAVEEALYEWIEEVESQEVPA